MVANAVDSCAESANSLPSADKCQVSSYSKSKCVVMVTRFLLLLDIPLCNDSQHSFSLQAAQQLLNVLGSYSFC